MAKTKKDIASLFNLEFNGKTTNHYPNETTATVTKSNLTVRYNQTDHLKHVSVYLNERLNTVGLATVNKSAGDKFNKEIGQKMSSARSENEAYYESIKILSEVEREAEQIVSAARAKKQLLKEYIEHNKKYIKTLV